VRANTDHGPALGLACHSVTPVSSSALARHHRCCRPSLDTHYRLSTIPTSFAETPAPVAQGLGHAFNQLYWPPMHGCVGYGSSFDAAPATACAAPCTASFPHPTAPRAHTRPASASAIFSENRVSRPTHCLLAPDDVWEDDPLPQLCPTHKWRPQLAIICTLSRKPGARSSIVRCNFFSFVWRFPSSFVALVWSQVLARALMSHLGSTDYSKFGNRLQKWGPTHREPCLTTRGHGSTS
jgi:hypothetical protein